MTLQNQDNEIFNLITLEAKRQIEHIELIASENYVSKAVLEAQGSILTNKYAEGYSGKRYYGGCEFIDQVESIAIERVKKLFKAEYANVQPHSGSQANQAVYFATLKPGDTILGMSLTCGGHLTHGSPVNLSGKLFNVISYGLNDNEIIDYATVEKLAEQHKPKLIIAGASAYSLTIDFEKFRYIADKVGAYLMADIAHYAGLIAAEQYPSPIKYADFVTSTTHKTMRGPRGGLILAQEKYAKIINSSIFPGLQGGPLEHIIAAKAVAFKEAATDAFRAYQIQVKKNARAMADRLAYHQFRIVSSTTESHLFLVDLRSKNINGAEAEKLLESVNITLNKNTIPHDPQPPSVTSGIRIGTPAITTRGFNELDCIEVANVIADAIHRSKPIDHIKQRVAALCSKHNVLNAT